MNKGTIFRFYGMTVLAFFFLAISMVVTGAVLPHWMDLFQISASQAGRLIFLYYISYVIVTFLSGFLCDHFGKKPVLVLSQIFLAAGFFIISTADSFLTIEFGMLIMGLGGGFCEAPLTILISNVFSGKEGFALNMSQLFFGIGAATGPFLAGFILEKGITWRIMYIIPGIVSLFILFLLLTEKTLFAHDRKGIQKGGVLKLFQHWKCFLLINFLAMFLYVGAEIAGSSWMSTYIVRELRGNIYLGGLAMTGFWGMVTIGRLVFAYLSHHFPYGSLLRFSTVLSFCFFLLLLFTSTVPLALVAFMGIGFGFSGIWPLIMALVAQNIDEMQATAIGLVTACGGIGALLFPWVFGIFSDYLGLRFIFFLVILMVAGMFGIFQMRFFQPLPGLVAKRT